MQGVLSRLLALKVCVLLHLLSLILAAFTVSPGLATPGMLRVLGNVIQVEEDFLHACGKQNQEYQHSHNLLSHR